jgi:uncharacterized DUF497 family protein
MKLKFEWDNAKAQANLRAHGVSFDLAKSVFKDPFAIELCDDREDYGEERFILIGLYPDREGGGKRPLVCSLYRTQGTYPHHFSSKGDTI